MASRKRCLTGVRMAGWLADCLAGGQGGCLFASLLAAWLAKVSDGWPAACLTACHLMSPSSRSRHACLPSSPYYAAALGQANYPLARIPTCFHSAINDSKKKLRFLVITVLHLPLRASGLSPGLNSCMLFGFLSVNPRKKINFLAITVLHAPAGELSPC